jgi:transcriptional regulator with XRE-family HTH domain
MPRKPRFIHPVRQVRTCLGHSQPYFAKLVGCSAAAIQRIENGTLQLSQKLAISILEATGADPVSLLAGPDAKALDVSGGEYTKDAYTIYKSLLPCDQKEIQILFIKIFHQIQLLFLASNRGGRFKTYVLNSALQRALMNLAEDFELTQTIHRILLESGHSEKRIYRVSDLRKFSEYANILGYKDDKRYSPHKLVNFVLPRGWLAGYYLIEKPVLAHGADMKLRNAKYILDSERYIPPEIKEALDQALYWEITEFRSTFAAKPVR